MMRYSLAALSAVLMLSMSPYAWAQSQPVYQSGSMSPHHLPKFLANGKLGDVGGLTGDVNGRGVAPFSVQDNLGLGQCFNSAATAAGYRAFCLGHDASGNALLTVDSYGGAAAGSLKARVNGATVDLVTGSTSGLAAVATSGSASDLTTGTVPIARLSISCANLTDEGTGCAGNLPVAANPTGTGSDVAVNGVATTFMRSDASPAIQKASAGQFGVAKVDGTTITSSGGVLTAVTSGVSATAASADVVVTPSPGIAAFTIGTTAAVNAPADGGSHSYTVLVGDKTKRLALVDTFTALAVPQATGSFGAGFKFMECHSGTVTATSTTSTVNGIAGATGVKLGTFNCSEWTSSAGQWIVSVGVPTDPTQRAAAFLAGTNAWSTLACATLTDDGPYCNAVLGQLPGTTTNDTASAGNIGEGVFVSLAKGSAHALTTATGDNLITQSFGAGDWEVWGTVCFTGNAATTVGSVAGGITTVSATIPTAPGTVGTSGAQLIHNSATLFSAVSDECFAIGSTRILVAGATPVYLVGLSNFAVNTLSAYGAIHGRRVR